MVKYFGLPEDIVSNRDARFAGWFWIKLFNSMGSEFPFSTANHPQTDDGENQCLAGIVSKALCIGKSEKLDEVTSSSAIICTSLPQLV